MRSLTYLVATTLDGFIAGPDGADPSSLWPITPDYIQHIAEHYPETLPGQAREAMGISGAGREFDTVVEGRRSGTLAHSLVDEINRLVLKVSPLTLGAGIPLWGREAQASLRTWRLIDETELDSGARFSSYEPAS